jgi:membrane-bound metal-dependent hydrolase YbcI (DUF457 family)
MFVGHLAVALAAKRVGPRLSLGWLVGAVAAADLLWPLFLLAGIERVRIEPGATAFTPLVFESYPWSHSLLMLVLWGFVLGIFARRGGMSDMRTLWLITALVVSHWVLDFVTHAPDMPLWPTATSPRLGLALWNSIPGTLIVEGLLWVTCLTLFLSGRQARNWVGRFAFWSFAVVCTVMWAAGPWSPPPASERAIAWFSLIGWITVPWAIWADRGYTGRAA